MMSAPCLGAWPRAARSGKVAVRENLRGNHGPAVGDSQDPAGHYFDLHTRRALVNVVFAELLVPVGHLHGYVADRTGHGRVESARIIS